MIEYYNIIKCKLDNNITFVIWIINEESGSRLYCIDNICPIWKSYDKAKFYLTEINERLDDEQHDEMFYDLDILTDWLDWPHKKSIDSNKFLEYWNLFDDLAIGLGQRWLGKEHKYDPIYQKLFAGALPGKLDNGRYYIPKWSKSEVALITNVLKEGLTLFRSSSRIFL